MANKRDPFLLAKIIEEKRNPDQGIVTVDQISRKLGISKKTTSAYLNCPEMKIANAHLMKELLGTVAKANDTVMQALDFDYSDVITEDMDAKQRVRICELQAKQADLGLQILKTLGREHISMQPKVVQKETLMLSNEDRKGKEAELKALLAEELAEEKTIDVQNINETENVNE